MEIGINWDDRFASPEQQAEAYLRNGVRHTFLAAGLTEAPKKDLAAARAAGITVDNYHAPWDGINDMWLPGDAGEVTLAMLKRSVDQCAEGEVPLLVVHLSSKVNAPRVSDVGFDRFSRLMEHARKNDVTIAFENQRKLANLAFAFEVFPDAKFCWDCGHEQCFTPGRHYMPLFGDRLGALHLHDNSCVYDEDQHKLPYDGNADFDAIAQYIADSGYTGTLMLEVGYRWDGRHFYDDVSPDEFIRRAAEAARRLNADVEAKRAAKH